jgi:hypothetical protein
VEIPDRSRLGDPFINPQEIMKSKTRQLNLFPTAERGQLAQQYTSLIEERLNLRALLGFRLNKAEAIFWKKNED